MPDPNRSWIAPFAAAVVGMTTLQMSSIGFSPLLPSIQSAFHMNYAQVGLFTGMYGLLALALSVPAGLVANRFGEKRTLLGGMLVVALGLFLLSRAPGFAAAVAARGLWLAGYRFAFICVLTAVAVTCPPSLKGRSMGIVGAVGSLASVLGAPFGSSIGQAFGWRNGILAFAAATLVGAAIVHAFYRGGGSGARDVAAGPHAVGSPATHGDTAPALRGGASGGAAAPSAFRTPLVYAFALLVGLVGMGAFSATFFVPSAARAVFGLSAVSAAFIISAGYMLAIVLNLLVGYLMDRFDKWRVLGVAIASMIPAALMMTSHDLLLFRIGTALLIALGFTATNQVYGVAGEVFEGREVGNVMGVVSLGAGLCGYVGPQALGALRDWTGSFNAGWYAAAGVATITLLQVMVLHRIRPATATARASVGA